MNDPKTVPELLDAAAAVDDNGESFGRALMGLFSALEKARDE